MKDIERQLNSLPKFQAESIFKDKLKQQVFANTKTSRSPVLWTYLPRLAFFILMLVVIGGGYWSFNREKGSQPRVSLELFQAAPASAAEIIEKHISIYHTGDTLYHLVYKHFVYYQTTDPKPTVYDLREDRESDRFMQDITYPDGSRAQQGFDLDMRWNINFTKKTVDKDLYIWPNEGEKFARHSGGRVSEVEKLRQLVTDGQLTLEEAEYAGRLVYKIRDTRQTIDKSWDVILFDKDTYALLVKEKYNDDGTLKERVIQELEESLPRTDDNIAQLFSLRIPNEFSVRARHFDTRTGYVESDYYSVTATTNTIDAEMATPSSKITPSPSSLP